MSVRIAICTPVPDAGLELMKLLVESAVRLASGKHKIEIQFTCHSEAQRTAILKCELAAPIGSSHIIERETSVFFHANSITHSRCVNALFSSAQTDLAIICDFDIAFTYRGWDLVLIDQILGRSIAFVGNPY